MSMVMARIAGALAMIGAAAAPQPEVIGLGSQPKLLPQRKVRRKRGRYRHRLGKTGRVTPPNSASVKSWARYLAKQGRASIQIKNPDRYLHSHARAMRKLVIA